ncbi:MAG: tetratricopeptide repeat protein [Kiritimatiellia bacterium]
MNALTQRVFRQAWILLVIGMEIQAQTGQSSPPPPPSALPLTNFQPRFQLAPLPEPGATVTSEENVAPTPPARGALYEGLITAQDGDYSNAVPYLQKAIAEDPSLIGAWQALGWCYWNLGEKDKAELTWVRLLKLAPANPMPYNLLAQIETNKKNLEKAEELLRKSLELDPTQFDTRLSLGLILAWQSKSEEANKLLGQLVKEEPDRIDVRVELAHTHYVLQQYEESAEQWKVVCEVIPDNPEYLIEWARCLLYSGELEEAERVAQKAAEIDGGSLRALNVLSDVAEISNRLEEATPKIRKLLELTDVAITRSQLRSRLVMILRRLYDKDPKRFPLKDIIEECRTAIDEDPRNVNMMLFLAEIYVMDLRYDDAIKLLLHIHDDINPLNYRAQRSLFETYLVRRDFEKASLMIDEIYASPTADLPYRFMDAARLEFIKGNYAEAVRTLDLMERESMQGSVLTLAYSGLAVSDWEPGMPVRLFREHVLFLKRAGYKFLTPDEVLPYFESRKTRDVGPKMPAPYRFFRWMNYAFTGANPPSNEATDLESYRPDRVVCVTFDGARRTSFAHATPVAEEFDAPLTMHIPVGNIARSDYGICSWEEILDYMDSGLWTIGSGCIDAGIQVAGYADGYRVWPLPNRLWLTEKKRLESLREWSRRVNAEIRDSRKIIVEKLGLDPTNGCRSVAYPFGEIGQMEGSNIDTAGNVPVRLVNEASMVYRTGFIQSLFGFSTVANNPLVHGRYQPGKDETGQQVLNHAIEKQPVMMARRLKAELAALQGKPHLAYRMLKLLERDGFPAESLRKLREYVDQRIAGRIEQTASGKEPDENESGFDLSNPYLGVDGFSTKANRQIDITEFGIRGGLHLTPALVLEGWMKEGTISQEVESNRLVKIKDTRTSQTLVITTGSDNGEPINKREQTTTIQTDEIQSNTVMRSTFDADYTYGGFRLSYRLPDGSNLEGHLGVKGYDGAEESADEPVWGAAHLWHPAPSLDINSRYDRDLVPSGRRAITSDSVGIKALWRARDWWEIEAFGRYSHYSETNAMLHLKGSSMWLISEQQSIFAGIQYELTTVDEDSDYIWSPYWDERVYFALRMNRSFPTFYASAEAKIGMAREEGRPADMEQWKKLKVQGENQGFYAGDKPGSDWDTTVGLSGALRRMIGRHLELEATAGTSFYSEYSEYLISGSLLYHF